MESVLISYPESLILKPSEWFLCDDFSLSIGRREELGFLCCCCHLLVFKKFHFAFGMYSLGLSVFLQLDAGFARFALLCPCAGWVAFTTVSIHMAPSWQYRCHINGSAAQARVGRLALVLDCLRNSHFSNICWINNIDALFHLFSKSFSRRW